MSSPSWRLFNVGVSARGNDASNDEALCAARPTSPLCLTSCGCEQSWVPIPSDCRSSDLGLRRLWPLVPSASAAFGQQRGVEQVEVLGVQLLDRSTTQHRQHVQACCGDRVVGAGPAICTSDRQPPVDQVLAEASADRCRRGGRLISVMRTFGVAAPGPGWGARSGASCRS